MATRLSSWTCILTTSKAESWTARKRAGEIKSGRVRGSKDWRQLSVQKTGYPAPWIRRKMSRGRCEMQAKEKVENDLAIENALVRGREVWIEAMQVC
jgi:hypothetical protein